MFFVHPRAVCLYLFVLIVMACFVILLYDLFANKSRAPLLRESLYLLCGFVFMFLMVAPSAHRVLATCLWKAGIGFQCAIPSIASKSGKIT
jgi:hypothetical protein